MRVAVDVIEDRVGCPDYLRTYSLLEEFFISIPWFVVIIETILPSFSSSFSNFILLATLTKVPNSVLSMVPSLTTFSCFFAFRLFRFFFVVSRQQPIEPLVVVVVQTRSTDPMDG
jgi:hypothetical protein